MKGKLNALSALVFGLATRSQGTHRLYKLLTFHRAGFDSIMKNCMKTFSYLRLIFLGVLLCSDAARADEITLAVKPVNAAGIVPDATASDLMPFKIFNFSAHSLAFSPDGKTLAVGDGHGVVRFWDTANGQLRATVPAHEGWAFSVGWFADGKRFVSGGKDRLIHVRDAADLTKIIRTLRGHDGDVHAVAVTADGSALVSAGDDKIIRVWDTSNAQTGRVLDGHERQIPTIALNPAGTLIASGSRDRTIRLWELNSGLATGVITNHKADVLSVKFSPDGRRLASGSYDQTVRLWDVKTLAPLNVLTGHTYRVYSVAFAPDGNQLASAGDKTARLWNTESGQNTRVFTLDAQIQAAQSVIPGAVSAVTYRPDGKQLAIATTLGAVILVAPDTGTLLHTLTPPAPTAP